jgi:AcrR family transcriptional regulator
MSPRTALAVQKIKDARREAILTAGRKVFARHGLAAARSSDIASEAGISQGLIYHYFSSKDALFTSIVEDALRATARLIAEALQAPGPAWPRLERLGGHMLAGVVEYPEYPLVIVQAYTSAVVPVEARAAVETYGQQSFRDLVALLQQGQSEGSVVASDPVELALAFTAYVQGVSLSRLESNSSAPPAPRAATILRMLRA